MAGRDPAAPYVPVQAVVVGSVMQFFNAVTSVVMLVHVLESHLDARVLGRLVPALKYKHNLYICYKQFIIYP